jgi:two-component system, LytTR family, response regulator
LGFKLQESESFTQKRLVIKTDGRFLFLDQNEILWLEAEGNYVQIHTNQNPVLMRCGISTLEKELAPNFIRISRSTIVNLNHVREMPLDARKLSSSHDRWQSTHIDPWISE